MRTLALISVLAVAQPVLGQTPNTPRSPFDDAIIVRPIAPPVNVPAPGQLFQIPQPPNSIADLQQAIDKTIASKTKTVLVMDLDSVMLSKASISAGDLYIRDLIAKLKSIQVRMFDVEEDARSRVQPIRDLLKSPHWVRYSAYTSTSEEIEIWSARWGTSQTGVFLLSINGKRVFTMNVGGNLGPDQLVYLSGLFGIPNFKPKLEVPLDSPVK